MFNLEEKIAIVTGASRGIGEAIAKSYADSGAHVVCVSRTESALKTVQKKIKDNGGSASIYSCDVSQFNQVEPLINNTLEEFGKIDVIVNNAGITRDNILIRMSEEEWEAVINTNLTGYFNCCKAVIKQMIKQKHGRIINISSIIGLNGNSGQTN